MPKRLVVVLGMHRNGTSTIARGLQVLGVQFGINLISGFIGVNDNDYWEDTDVNALNVSLLQALGHDWHTPAPPSKDELTGPIAAGFRIAAVQLLRARSEAAPIFGVKDPRMARLLPFWQSVFQGLDVQPSYLIACRNPLSVARSLAKRDGFAPQKSHYLWFEHMLCSLMHTGGHSRVAVDYDGLIDDPEAQLTRIAHKLNLPFDPGSRKFNEYRNEFLENSPRHAKFDAKDLASDPAVPGIVVELHSILQNLAGDRVEFDSPHLATLLERLNEQHKKMLPAPAFMRELDDKATGLERSIREQNTRINVLEKALHEQDRRAAIEHDALKKQIAALNKVIAARDAQYSAIQTSLFWRATYPMRAVLMKHPRLRRIVRGAAKALWQAIHFQPLTLYRQRQPQQAAEPHFAPPVNDHALAVPFSYVPALSNTTPSLAVVCHMYFEEMAEEFKRYLSNIPFGFDLYITTSSDEKKQIIFRAFESWRSGRVEIRIAENRGRDIAPKLITCRDVYEKYAFVLHIHSKNTPYKHTKGWRTYLLETLIGSPDIVKSVFEIFSNHPSIGIIAPQHIEGVRPGIGWGFNYQIARSLLARLNLNVGLDGYLDFPAGSMFWARSSALKPLLEIGLSFRDFPAEKGQQDSTLAHAIERLYFFICESAGFDWLKIAKPELLSQSRHRTIDVANPQALAAYISAYRVRLLNTGSEEGNTVNRGYSSAPH